MGRPKGSKNKKAAEEAAAAAAASSATAVGDAGDAKPPETATTPPESEKKPAPEKERASPPAADLEAQTNTRLDGDTWTNGKLMRRLVPGKTVSIKVERPASTEERAGAAHRLAHARRALRALKLEKKTLLGDFKKRETELDEEEELALLTYDQNLVMRPVPFDLFYDFENNVKYRVARDNGEERDASPLEPHERQSAMPGSEKTKVLPLRSIAGGKKSEESKPDEKPAAASEATAAPAASSGPVPGTKEWVKKDLPGFECEDKNRPFWVAAFTKAINHAEHTGIHTDLKDPNSPLEKRDYLKPIEIDGIRAGGMKELAEKAAKAKLAAEVANPPVGSPDGGTNKPPQKRYEPSADDPSKCKWCQEDEFDHYEDGRCAKAPVQA